MEPKTQEGQSHIRQYARLALLMLLLSFTPGCTTSDQSEISSSATLPSVPLSDTDSTMPISNDSSQNAVNGATSNPAFFQQNAYPIPLSECRSGNLPTVTYVDPGLIEGMNQLPDDMQRLFGLAVGGQYSGPPIALTTSIAECPIGASGCYLPHNETRGYALLAVDILGDDSDKKILLHEGIHALEMEQGANCTPQFYELARNFRNDYADLHKEIVAELPYPELMFNIQLGLERPFGLSPEKVTSMVSLMEQTYPGLSATEFLPNGDTQELIYNSIMNYEQSGIFSNLDPAIEIEKLKQLSILILKYRNLTSEERNSYLAIKNEGEYPLELGVLLYNYADMGREVTPYLITKIVSEGYPIHDSLVLYYSYLLSTRNERNEGDDLFVRITLSNMQNLFKEDKMDVSNKYRLDKRSVERLRSGYFR